MPDINKIVTSETVKDALRSEEVRSVLKQKIRSTFEAQIDAEVDEILAELTGEPIESTEMLTDPEEPVNTIDDPLVLQ
ncbi:TPA: DUF826 domain-containing protein [Escherichia coli]|nr:DUF826 domain-containing protein [Escherichia coli]HAX1979640.1 DUF826 domain-containing protein [Escherichia coli]HAX2346870.1 DUF826 domain-containing protein [Escherichia coli]HBN7236988.1 DUF826 domain-containing protein [Escherichia coli]HBN7443523.1 DUF826 domain-containing protein [Escherichia coli]